MTPVSELPAFGIAIGFFSTVLLVILLIWLLCRPFIKVTKEEDPSEEIRRRLDTFKKDTSEKNARALLRVLPRSVYQFTWYDGSTLSWSGTGIMSVSRMHAGTQSWNIPQVEEYLKECAKDK